MWLLQKMSSMWILPAIYLCLQFTQVSTSGCPYVEKWTRRRRERKNKEFPRVSRFQTDSKKKGVWLNNIPPPSWYIYGICILKVLFIMQCYLMVKEGLLIPFCQGLCTSPTHTLIDRSVDKLLWNATLRAENLWLCQ